MERLDEGDDATCIDNNCFPQQNFEGIMQKCRNEAEQTKRAQKIQPNKPKSVTEYFIYVIDRIQALFSMRCQPNIYCQYTFEMYKNFFLAIYFNWTTIFTSPTKVLVFILVYPLVSGAIFAFEIGLKLYTDFLGGSRIVKMISENYGHGYGAVNWGKPELLESSKVCHLIQSTLPSLGKSAPEDIKKTNGDCRHQKFDISIAQTFTVLSAIVYERQQEKVASVHKLFTEYKKNEQDLRTEEEVEMEMKQLLWESESRIRRLAAKYGLCFMSVTELRSLGGPYCGIYWPRDDSVDPFIIVAFKGTTPSNYNEFLVDATFHRTDARAYLFGAAHKGFHDSLFSTSDDDTDIREPYIAIRNAIRQKALQLQKNNKPVKLWVTGHSLGAALGALLFARFLKSPEDIEPLCELRDAYLLGTPAVGDSDFAAMFASYSNTPVYNSSNLWRIINKSDAACRSPLGYNNKTIGHYVSNNDLFNYFHIGHAVEITYPFLDRDPLEIHSSTYQPSIKVDIIVSGSEENNTTDAVAPIPNAPVRHYSRWIRPFLKHNPIPIIESMYPFFVRDHIPHQYFEGLDRARAYYNMCKKD